jgi:hypothetical protein
MTQNYENAYQRALWEITEGTRGANNKLGFNAKWGKAKRDQSFNPPKPPKPPGPRLGPNQIKILAALKPQGRNYRRLADTKFDGHIGNSDRALKSMERHGLVEKREIRGVGIRCGYRCYEWRLVK